MRNPKQIKSFTCAYWDYLRGKGGMPCYASYDLDEIDAIYIMRQCDLERIDQLNQQDEKENKPSWKSGIATETEGSGM